VRLVVYSRPVSARPFSSSQPQPAERWALLPPPRELVRDVVARVLVHRVPLDVDEVDVVASPHLRKQRRRSGGGVQVGLRRLVPSLHTQIQVTCKKKCNFPLLHAGEAQLPQPSEATNGSMGATAALVACIASTTAWSMFGLAYMHLCNAPLGPFAMRQGWATPIGDGAGASVLALIF
jgi:hypothetical protein